MTDPDERRNRVQQRNDFQAVSQPNFRAEAASSTTHQIPVQGLQAAAEIATGAQAGPSRQINILNMILETHLPENWNRPLAQNPLLQNIPQVPALYIRGRGQRVQQPVQSSLEQQLREHNEQRCLQHAQMLTNLRERNQRNEANAQHAREEEAHQVANAEIRQLNEQRLSQATNIERRLQEEEEERLRTQEIQRERAQQMQLQVQEQIRLAREQEMQQILAEWRLEHIEDDHDDIEHENDPEALRNMHQFHRQGQQDNNAPDHEQENFYRAGEIDGEDGENLDNPPIQQYRNIHPLQQHIPLGCRPYNGQIEKHDLGSMDKLCLKCSALHFSSEKLTASTINNSKFGMCCLQGQVHLPPFNAMHPDLKKFMCGQMPQSKEFKANIRCYNASLAFTSLGANIDQTITRASGPYCFKISGKLHHLSGTLLPEPGEPAKYAQIYIYDADEQLDIRMRNNQGCNQFVMSELQSLLLEHHPFVQHYRQAHEIMHNHIQQHPQHDVSIRIHTDKTMDLRRYNAPTGDEIAVLLPGHGAEDRSENRDIVLCLKDGGLRRISHLYPSYSCLHYVLLFPYGEDGWHTEIPSRPGPNGEIRSEMVSQRCYYAYQFHIRSGEPAQQPLLFWGGKLFQQYVVDAWASIEQSYLNWIMHHQKEIRADVYQGLRDVVLGDNDNNIALENHGRRIILPSSHSGSDRHMNQLFQDSMAICRAFHKPDIFLTMTANPNWPEIQAALLEDLTPDKEKQSAADRPEIVARVFELKKKALLQEIKTGLFGTVVATVHTIEFQKWGLPHMHLLIFLDRPYKIRDAAHVDSIVYATLPDPETEPELYEVVTTVMLHGPCGDHKRNAKCMVDGRCSKRYPKEFNDTTIYGEDGYPKYARPNNHRILQKNNFDYDNRWVVPYNKYLSAKYRCHINVEICASVEAIKYIHKYIYKGHDKATLEVYARDDQQRDEIKEYLDARYISPIEACWRIFEFPMHAETPAVYRLPVHLPDQQLVYYNPDQTADEVLARNNIGTTALTAWFEANQTFGAASANILYQDFPCTYVYNKQSKKWTPQQRSYAIGRMYFASPNQGERFYLRLLLSVVSGATGYEFLRTYNGILHPTFRSACLARGLLEDDAEWDQCLREASVFQSGFALRSLFAIILRHCKPAKPEDLWHNHKHSICDDLNHRLRNMNQYQDRVFTAEQIHDYGLYLLNHTLKQAGTDLTQFPDMPLPQGPQEGENWGLTPENFTLFEEQNYNCAELANMVIENRRKFNHEQNTVFDAAIQSVQQNLGQIIFIHSAGGCGKTFVCNTIAADIRSQGDVALCVASSGIAALLLEGGRTAHSRFRIPIPVDEASVASLTTRHHMYDVLLHTKVIIWDEVPMQHHYGILSVDHCLRHLLRKDVPFAGITIVFGGDFRQTLPVIPRGLRPDVVGASFCKSSLWKDVHVYYLVQNMRLDRTAESDNHARWLLEVGSGSNTSNDHTIEIPPHMCVQSTEELISAIYPAIHNPQPDQYFLDRTILSSRNDEVDDINATILEQFPGVQKVLMSADSVVLENPLLNNYQPYPPEYLHSLKASGLPLARLALKKGVPVMLLRNLDPLKGLCNGTRMIIIDIQDWVLKCRIISGDRKFSGTEVYIPRIILEPSSETLPVPLQRRQFPVRLAFAMTINKSQGQSVRHVGINLETSVFSHGQLYVALSRCTSGLRIKVLLPQNSTTGRTSNIVYSEVLTGLNL